MSPRFSTHSTAILTRDLYIPDILFRTSCAKHKAKLDEPCFTVPNMNIEGMFHSGICNDRAIKAGMDGKISIASLVRHAPKVIRRVK